MVLRGKFPCHFTYYHRRIYKNKYKHSNMYKIHYFDEPLDVDNVNQYLSSSVACRQKRVSGIFVRAGLHGHDKVLDECKRH